MLKQTLLRLNKTLKNKFLFPSKIFGGECPENIKKKMMDKLLLFTPFFCLLINTAYGEDMFAIPDPNEGHEEIITLSKDNSLPLQNVDYMKRSMEGQIKLHVSESNNQSLTNQGNQGNQLFQANQSSKTSGNSVIIGNGVTVNGNLIINNQVNGDTYVLGR